MNNILNSIFFFLFYLLIYASVSNIINRICQAFERCAYFKAAASCGQSLRDPYKNDGEGSNDSIRSE